MKNSDTLKFFQEIIAAKPEAGVEKYGQDNSAIDAEFIKNYLSPTTILLDIGSGTGLIVNKIQSFVSGITAVEPFKGFSQYIDQNPHIAIVNKSAFEFETKTLYDVLTLFGVMHYLNAAEALELYKKCYSWTKPGGIVIVKNQFGVKEDVVVAGYSENLKTNYYAQYRHIQGEINTLNEIGFKNIQHFDIYPPECNKWDNTHFYAIVATR